MLFHNSLSFVRSSLCLLFFLSLQNSLPNWTSALKNRCLRCVNDWFPRLRVQPTWATLQSAGYAVSRTAVRGERSARPAGEKHTGVPPGDWLNQGPLLLTENSTTAENYASFCELKQFLGWASVHNSSRVLSTIAILKLLFFSFVRPCPASSWSDNNPDVVLDELVYFPVLHSWWRRSFAKLKIFFFSFMLTPPTFSALCCKEGLGLVGNARSALFQRSAN